MSLRGLDKWDENVQHTGGQFTLIFLFYEPPLKITTGGFSFFLCCAVTVNISAVENMVCFFFFNPRVRVVIPSFHLEEKTLSLLFMFSKLFFF